MIKWLKKTLQNIRRKPAEEVETISLEAFVPELGTFDFHVHKGVDQYVSGDLIRNKIWEPFETEVFRRLCTPGDFVADIGANIGWYSVIASQLLGPSGKVASFEPSAKNFSVLQKNSLASTGLAKIEAFNFALSDKETNSKLFLSETNLGDHRLFDSDGERSFVTTQVQTLDKLFATSERKPTLVKSDTQGSEARILDGSQLLLSADWRPVFILEFWPFGLVNSKSEPAKLWSKLLALDYDIYEVSEDKLKLIPFTDESFQIRIDGDLSPASGNFLNLLCIQPDSEKNHLLRDLIESI